jgi:hypothetical protein
MPFFFLFTSPVRLTTGPSDHQITKKNENRLNRQGAKDAKKSSNVFLGVLGVLAVKAVLPEKLPFANESRASILN